MNASSDRANMPAAEASATYRTSCGYFEGISMNTSAVPMGSAMSVRSTQSISLHRHHEKHDRQHYDASSDPQRVVGQLARLCELHQPAREVGHARRAVHAGIIHDVAVEPRNDSAADQDNAVDKKLVDRK